MDELAVTKVTEDSHSVTLGWTPPAWQEGYLPTLDSSETMVDGKRHPGTSETAKQVRIGKPADETTPASKHRYGVKLLGSVSGGAWPPVPVPPDPPPNPTVETITATQFNSLVRQDAQIKDKRVVTATGALSSIGWSVPGVHLTNVEFDAITLNPGADGAALAQVKGRAFYIWGVNDWSIDHSVFDGQGRTDDCKLWDWSGVVGRRWAIRDSIFRHFSNDADPASHNQAIFVGSSLDGVIERNAFDDNGNTAHIFVSTWGINQSQGKPVTVPSVKIRGNTFGPTHPHPQTGAAWFSINVHPQEIPSGAAVCIESGQPTVKPLCNRAEFVKGACP